MMYVSYVKALTVGNKLTCVILLNTASTYQNPWTSVPRHKNTVNRLSYSVQFFPNTSTVTHKKMLVERDLMLLSVTFAVILVPRLTVSFGLWTFCAEQVET